MKVLVTHPGRQHSHQVALALERAGMLAGYWAGVPALDRHRRGVPRALWRRLVRYASIPLPKERVRWTPWVPALRRLGDLTLPPRIAAWTDFLACRLFDRWAAARLRSGETDAVMACEISCLETFRKARRLGMTTVLDAAATHYRTQDELHGFSESPTLHRRITAVKHEEIALADHVLTVSELARRSYLEAGVPPERVHRISLGVDVSLFVPSARETPTRKGTSFVFVGATSRVKGFDLLLEAFAQVHQAEPETRLLIIGPSGDAASLLDPQPPAGVAILGPLPQAELAVRLMGADCLVLPSRNESFGMVVPEALAAGLPVLVSDRVGAADLVREGKTGWVVPAGNAAALAKRMSWCTGHHEMLWAMKSDCRHAAETITWPAYHSRLTELMQTLLEPSPADPLFHRPPAQSGKEEPAFTG